MKLSIFTTITNPDERGDNALSALRCYRDLADELIIVNGGEPNNRFTKFADKIIEYEWPHEFDWRFIGQQFQRGYEAADGDWVIHADLDFIFHEKDFTQLRETLKKNSTQPALSFWKYQFILPDRYNLKSRLVLAVNRGVYGNRISFNSGGDLCQPSLNGKEIKPDDVPEARIPFYNYEKLTKNVTQMRYDAERMDRAYYEHFGNYVYQGSHHDALDGMIAMLKGRFEKPQQEIMLNEHPKYVQRTISDLTPDQWGYSGFGELGKNNYVKMR